MSRIARILPAALVAALPAQADTYNGYEMPRYSVENQLNGIEIRAYEPMILAEVTVEGARREALSRGFRVLAGYIFGGNQGRASVEMTAPVTQSAAERIEMTVPVAQIPDANGQWVVSFMMPRDWQLATLPAPNDPAIRLTETAPERLAVITFSGRATAARLADFEAMLQSRLDSAGITTAGPMRHAYYDDPFTLPWTRRNEVMVPVE